MPEPTPIPTRRVPVPRPPAEQPSEAFPHQVALGLRDEYLLFWRHDFYSVTFEIHAKTKGWVGLGISPSGKMPDSDIFTAGVRDGAEYIQVRELNTSFCLQRAAILNTLMPQYQTHTAYCQK